jgi:hypothetical protein
VFPAQAPFAEVLAIVRKDSVTVLAQPRSRAGDHFLQIETGIDARSHPNRPAIGEIRKRHLFYCTETEAASKAGIVNDPAFADVNAMMGVTASERDHMCGQGRRVIRL